MANITVGGSSNFSTLQILQVVQNSTVTTFDWASTPGGFENTNLSVSITPKFSTSKILVFASGWGNVDASTQGAFTLARAGTNLLSSSGGNNLNNQSGNISLCYYDSPATTSATTYSLQINRLGGTGGVHFPANVNGFVPTAVIVAVEIAQ